MRLLPRLTFRQWVGYTGFAFVFLIVAALLVWRGDILRAGLDPQIPFQTYDPPAAPDYSRPQAWAMLDERAPGAGPAHVFFVHSTTFEGGKDWNSPIGDAKADAYLERVVIPNYAGPFARAGDISAPRYRQGSLYTRLTLRDDAREARAFAFDDVAAAFGRYLSQDNRGRPFIIVGVEQGGFLAERLLIDLTPEQRSRLVAAYLIETAVPNDAPPLAPCSSRTQTRCMLAWVSAVDGDPDTVVEQLRHSLVWAGDRAVLFGQHRPVCVNPVTGALNGAATAKAHLGGANASNLDWEQRPAFLTHQVSTECKLDILQVSRPRSASLRPSGSWADQQRADPFNMFYADLEADAQARSAAISRQP